jgi:hypothetical protein
MPGKETSFHRDVANAIMSRAQVRQHAFDQSDEMTWIKTIAFDQSDETVQKIYQDLHAMYPPEYSESVPAVTRPDGTSDGVVAAHSLIPEAMWHMMAGLAVLLRPGGRLTRRQQEMIATVVSAQNSCFY